MTHYIHRLSEILSNFWSSNSGEFISALAGAFFGALAAYWFQLSAEKKKEANANHAAIMRAQLALISQLNILENVRRQHLDPFRDMPDRERKMVLLYRPKNHLAVDFDSLAFLLDSNNATLLLQIQVAERGFHSAMDGIDDRNQTMRDLHSRSEVERADVSTGQFTIRVDPRDIKLLKDNTDSLFSSVDSGEKQCAQAIIDLKAAGKKIFPKRRFLAVTAPQKGCP